ncbi:hypothetical protein DFP72DRAFT_1091861 [Ephemerocybe angulata]|uniref:Protein kinase domain-containing protein n=1 Tax=Ephemerocybe angulata TaxID=980116 RepID=A0A8H6IA42_9AGAR|nr:hypothetical protein DFP72DRAFT_1091861 [Tulosesus angulatus]
MGIFLMTLNGGETRAFRPRNAQHESFHNRIKSRVVLKNYGGFLNMFTSRHQVVAAFRDAILGHQNLFGKGILHRDVGMHNILLGAPGAKPGCRGIIIDLDMAVWFLKIMPSPCQDYRTGAQRYQPVDMLQNMLELSKMQSKNPVLQTALDDLESFFFVLLDILLMYELPRVPFQGAETTSRMFMKGLDGKELVAVIATKNTLLERRLDDVSGWWGDMCDVLLMEYQSLLKKIVKEKENIRWDKSISAEEKYDRLKELGSIEGSKPYYLEVTKAFDKALAAIEAEEDCGRDDDTFFDRHSSPCPPERQAAVPLPRRNGNLKRPFRAIHPDVTNVKRTIKNVRSVQPIDDERENENEPGEED